MTPFDDAEGGEESHRPPAPCVICGEPTELRCNTCRVVSCHLHDCPNDCDNRTPRAAVTRSVVLRDNTAVPMMTSITHYEPRLRHPIYVQRPSGQWVMGTIDSIDGDQITVIVDRECDPPV